MNSKFTPLGNISNNKKRDGRCLKSDAQRNPEYRTTQSEEEIVAQKDRTSHHWDISSGATNQDGPIGSQHPRKKTEHPITGTDPPGRRIRTVKESSNTESSGHRIVKKHLGSAGLSSPRRKESRKTLKHKSLYAQNPYLLRISRFERISPFTRKAILIRTQ